MAKNVQINGATYSGVPHVNIPLAGDSGTATFYETSDATAQASHIIAGYTAYGPSGKITGSASMPTVSQDSTTHVLTIS